MSNRGRDCISSKAIDFISKVSILQLAERIKYSHHACTALFIATTYKNICISYSITNTERFIYW